MKKPYLKIRTRYGRSTYSETEVELEDNDEWWGVFTDELKISFADEDMTSISVRRIK